MKTLAFWVALFIAPSAFGSEYLNTSCVDDKNQLQLRIFHNLEAQEAGYLIRTLGDQEFRGSGRFSAVHSGFVEDFQFLGINYVINETGSEGVALGFFNIKDLEEAPLGPLQGNAEGVFGFGDDDGANEVILVEADSCSFVKTQTFCHQLEDAIHYRFCSGLKNESMAPACEESAAKAVTARHQMPTSTAMGEIAIQSVQSIGSNLMQVGFKVVDSSSANEINRAYVEVKRDTNRGCYALDLLEDESQW